MIKKYSFFPLIFSIFLYLLFSFIFVSQVSALECASPKKYCAEHYTETCANGGVRECFKEGCNDTGGGGPTCPWQGSSRCGNCSSPGAPAPTAPIQSCEIISGGDVGRCVRISGEYSCQPSCNNDWSASPSEPNVECQELTCASCGNNNTCCRKISTSPPTQPPPPPPTQPPPTQPPGTPTPTITPGGPTLTPTPTITPGGPTLTATPTTPPGQPPPTTPPGQPTNTPVPTTPPGQPTNTPIPPNPPTPTGPTAIPTLTPVPGTPTPTYIPVALPTYRAGQTNPLNISKPAQTWRCLKSQYYAGPLQPAGKKDHRLRLTGTGFPLKIPIHIVGCIATSTGTKCTSGNDNLDQTLELNKDPNHTFVVQPDNPMTTNDYNGTVDKVVYSSTIDSTVHAFYAILLNKPMIDPRTGGTIQYKSFKFKEDITKCTAVRWDPYGRVFDSQSLEPLPDVKITILDVNKNMVNLPGLINPNRTELNGAFSFLVEAGSYYLIPQPSNGYVFVKNPILDPGYIKAYSNLYRPNDLIVEKEGQPEHRDIPLDPGKNEPYRSSPAAINFAVLPIEGTNQTKIVGQVSHPLTIVSLKQNDKEIAKTWADKMGFYEFLIDNQNITQGVKIIPHFTKVNLAEHLTQTKQEKNILGKIFDYIQSFFRKKTTASTTAFGIPIEPIPRYLEGYLAANALVNIKLTLSDKIYWQTKTDERGFLVVLPQNLPLFDFYLEVIPPNAPSFTLTTGEFIEKNKEYLNSNNINLMTATINDQPIINHL